MYTRQTAFETSLAHLRQQGKPAVSVTQRCLTTCFYRTDDNLKCAVGALIPDNLYHTSMETVGAGTLRTKFPDIVSRLWEETDDVFMQGLQSDLHDCFKGKNDSFPVWLEQQALIFAIRWRLVFPEAK